MYNFCLSDTGTDAIINILNKNGEALWPESKPNGFDPLNLIQIMLAKENISQIYAENRYACRLFYVIASADAW